MGNTKVLKKGVTILNDFKMGLAMMPSRLQQRMLGGRKQLQGLC